MEPTTATANTAPVVDLGFSHFLTQADTVSHTILLIMLLLSASSWAVILTKAVGNFLEKNHSANFLHFFWEAPNLTVIHQYLLEHGVKEPFAHLVHDGFVAIDMHQRRQHNHMMEAGSLDEFLTRSLRRTIEQETARKETGLTLLASVGSAAPFIGLLGTVWGIYHALITIAQSGQGTLDKVAGPVGEALIMTALGLATAIPAVLAYNVFNRQNRLVLSELEGFAHDVFAFISTGHRHQKSTKPTNTKPVATALAS